MHVLTSYLYEEIVAEYVHACTCAVTVIHAGYTNIIITFIGLRILIHKIQ